MKVNVFGILQCNAQFDVATGRYSLYFEDYDLGNHVEIVDDGDDVTEAPSFHQLLLDISENKLTSSGLKARLTNAAEAARKALDRTFFPIPTGYSRDEIEAYDAERHEQRKLSLVAQVEATGAKWALEALKNDYGAEVEISVRLVEPTPEPLSEAA